VLAEAMRPATPVVATRVGASPRSRPDGVTGRLVEPGRPDELAAAVLEVLAARDTMGAAAREHWPSASAPTPTPTASSGSCSGRSPPRGVA